MGKDKKRKKDKETAKGPTEKKQHKEADGCYFCKKTGHLKKDCAKYHTHISVSRYCS